jgi:hypothetical protein
MYGGVKVADSGHVQGPAYKIISTVFVARDALRVNVPILIAMMQMWDSSVAFSLTTPRRFEIRS